jgi:dipeptidase D
MSPENSPLVIAAQKYFNSEVKSAKVLEYFEMISSIPHISNWEAALADRLVEWASENNLASKIDDAGNVWITREASLGCEEAQEIILQGHLDMVPDKEETNDFDFDNSPIPLEVTRDGYIQSAAKTSLGADNGVGVALAMAILTDQNIKTGKITALFTVAEEVGLEGAMNVKKEDLPSNAWLINLDSEGITIGCAGGVTIHGDIVIEYEKEPVNGFAYQIEISNLPGGHSGCDINKNRGNAIISMLEFLQDFPELYINRIDGGTLPNVIPSSCKVKGVAKEDIFNRLTDLSIVHSSLIKSKLNLPKDVEVISISRLEETSLQCFEQDFSEKLIENLLKLPNGLIDYNYKYNCVKSSNNFASISTDNGDGDIDIYLHPRSMDNTKWYLISEEIKQIVYSLKGFVKNSHDYSGWVPKRTSKLRSKVKKVYRKFKKPTLVEVTHGGLECGYFSYLQPDMDIISIGPDKIENIHTYKERVHLSGIEEFLPILQAIVSCE